MRPSRKRSLLWLRVILSTLGTGAAFAILYRIQDFLPPSSRRTELIFVLMLVTVLLLWSLTDALILLVRRAVGNPPGSSASRTKSSQSDMRIPLSTDIPQSSSRLDLPESHSDPMRKDS